jgi:hypothetical protein
MTTVHYIHVDSKNRDTARFPYGNSYVVTLPHVIKSVVKVDLVTAKVPNSMYNLTDGANVFSTNTVTVSLEQGFYSVQLLADEINDRLNVNESIRYLQAEGKFVYLTNDSTSSITVNSQEMSKMLGLNQYKTYTVTPLDVAIGGFSYGLKSDRVVDFSLNEFVFLDIEEFRTPFFSDTNTTTSSAGNMFAVIPMDVPSTLVKTFKENTDYVMSQALTSQQTISKLTIHWYDKNLKHLNFQGFENNGFILRVHTDQVTKAPPDPEAEQRAMVESMIAEIKMRLAEEEASKKKVEEMKKKVTFGKWAVFFGILCVLVFWYFTYKKPV